MTDKQKQFVDWMIDKCENHEQWLSIVRFGLPTLIADQAVLIELIVRQSQKLAKTKVDMQAPEFVTIILEQLQLKLTLTTA